MYAHAQGGQPAPYGLNIRDFGAVGDCRHDDTSAFQTAVDKINGHTLLIPSGCYLLTRPIQIPLSYGWRILGESETGTILRQQTDNTPIFVISQELTHGWEIGYLQMEWTKPQPASNTKASAILFSPTTKTNGGGIFNFSIHNIDFHNGFRGINLGPGMGSPLLLWGFRLEDLVAERDMSGATLYLKPVPAGGQTRCQLRNIYSSQSIAEPQIVLNYCAGGTADNIEDNNGLNTSINFTSNHAFSVRGIHIELHKMTVANLPIIAAENASITFDGITADYWSNVPGNIYLLSNVAGGGSLAIRNVSFSKVNEGNLGAVNPNSQAHVLRLAGTVNLLELSGMDLNRADAFNQNDVNTAVKVRAVPQQQQH